MAQMSLNLRGPNAKCQFSLHSSQWRMSAANGRTRAGAKKILQATASAAAVTEYVERA